MKKLVGFEKGINLGGWLSQCDYSEDRLDNFITEPAFAKIARWGLDHVRLPIDYNILEREQEDGSIAYLEKGFERIENAVLLAKKYDLHIVIDLHKTAGFSFDHNEREGGFFESEKYQQRFISLWEQLAERFAKYSDIAAFELLNEVTEQHFIGVWNSVTEQCIKVIRKYAPDIPVLVGSYWNNSPDAVPDLASPYDENVFYNFHCYAPLHFTHQGAHWTREIDQEARFTFEEANITPDIFEKSFIKAIEKAEAEGTGVYCGEYGVIDKAQPEDALKWFKMIHSVFEKFGIARAAWSYKEMDFGLSDSRMKGVIDELIKYL